MKVHKSPDRSPYLQNRAPLKEKTYLELPYGAIRPAGWLRQRLVDLRSGVAFGPEGDGELLERGPDWVDGLLPLAYLLDDGDLQVKIKSWIEWLVARERWDRWPEGVLPKVMQRYYSMSGDSRILSLLLGSARSQLKNGDVRPEGGSLEVIHWLYNVTGQKFLLDLADAAQDASFGVGYYDQIERIAYRMPADAGIADQPFPGWPDFVQGLWQSTAEGGLATLLYGPCSVKALVGGGIEVELTEETDLPFTGTIRFVYNSSHDAAFSLHLRVPGWCSEASIRVNGHMWTAARGNQMVLVFRKWKRGDVMELVTGSMT